MSLSVISLNSFMRLLNSFLQHSISSFQGLCAVQLLLTPFALFFRHRHSRVAQPQSVFVFDHEAFWLRHESSNLCKSFHSLLTVHWSTSLEAEQKPRIWLRVNGVPIWYHFNDKKGHLCHRLSYWPSCILGWLDGNLILWNVWRHWYIYSKH